MHNCGGMHNKRNQWQCNSNCSNVSVLFIHSGRIPLTQIKNKVFVCTPKNNIEDKDQKRGGGKWKRRKLK
jgi:hypothetical protein